MNPGFRFSSHVSNCFTSGALGVKVEVGDGDGEEAAVENERR